MRLKERLKNLAQPRDAPAGQAFNAPVLDLFTPNVVAITGTTGNFGAYLLDHFMRDANVEKIYCLNRSANAWERQAKAHAVRGLSTSFPDGFVEFLQVDLEKEKLGLEDDAYARLATDVTLVVHNAWVWTLICRQCSLPNLLFEMF